MVEPDAVLEVPDGVLYLGMTVVSFEEDRLTITVGHKAVGGPVDQQGQNMPCRPDALNSSTPDRAYKRPVPVGRWMTPFGTRGACPGAGATSIDWSRRLVT